MSNKNFLKIENISKSFGKIKVLENINLKILRVSLKVKQKKFTLNMEVEENPTKKGTRDNSGYQFFKNC